MKQQLLTTEAIALWQWAVKNHNVNWGCWENYPVSGCSYLSFDNNPIVIKFDKLTEYNGEQFKRIGWGRSVPGNEPSITFGMLYDLIPKDERPEKDLAPPYEFVHENGNKFILKQSEYCDYKHHTMSMIDVDGNIRNRFTEKSRLYGQLLECMPSNTTLYL